MITLATFTARAARVCTSVFALILLGASSSVLAATATLVPVADAYVQAGANATKNYGTATGIRIRTSATTANNYDSYLRYDTTSVAGTISNAKLRIYAKLSGTGTVSTTAYGVSITSWSETTITWNNKPVRGSTLGSVTVNSTRYAWKEIDVTSYVQSEFNAGRKVMSFAYHNSANTSPYITAYSRNSTSANKPQLLITYATNAAPTVSLTSPANNSIYIAPARVSLTAAAADSDGSINRVEFYNGATLLNTATSAPYSYNWIGVATGSYTLTAKAVDNSGAVTTSSPITITVNPAPNVPPTASLTSPANNSIYTAPASVSLTATAADSDGTINRVEFYNGATLLNTDTSAPYSYNWIGVVTGNYTLTAKAVDNSGAITTSSPINITVNPAPNAPPTVSLTSPANNSSYTAPASVSLTATAADSDGTINRVEFYNGATLLNTDTSAPYSYDWISVPTGVYALTAKAYDNASASTVSTVVNVTVNAANVSPSVSLTAPTNNATYAAPATITLDATAADSDGTITQVEFYNGAVLLNTDTSAPYTYQWTGVAAGSYSLTAKATDDKGASTTSAAVSVTVQAAMTATINYAYDEVGRLIAVTDSTGNAAQYDYDAVGNILAIKRLGSSSVSIIDFTPDTGSANTEVTITGTGFSATPSLNAVKFNGLGATVSSATATRLIVTAPIGVTTGPISVTTPLGNAISSSNFLVGGAPTITSFTPKIGAVGTPVTVTGTNFDTGLGRTQVWFNQTRIYNVSVASTISLTTAVPTNTASGKIRVVTPAGSVDSADDFIIPPPTIAVSDIVDIQRISVGGVQTLNVTPANKVGLLLVDVYANVDVTLNITALTTSPAASPVPYEIYSPNGVLLASGTLSDTARSIHLRRTQPGTYSIYFKPGAATATLSMALAADSALVLNGLPSNVSIGQPGQSVRLTFAGSAGQTLGLGITGLTLSPTGSTSANVSVYRQDGILQGYQTCYTAYPGCILNLRNLSVSGTYSVVVTPTAGGMGSFTATLSTQVVASLLLDGAPSNMSITRPGQTARLTFPGSVGQNLGLGITGLTLSPIGSTGADVNVNNPDTSGLIGIGCATAATAYGGCPLELRNLPASGSYSVEVMPTLAETGSFSATLSNDVVGTLTAGTSLNLSLSRAGQIGRLTFNGAAGDILGLALAGVMTTPVGDGTVYVTQPNGTSLTSFYFSDSSTSAQTLPLLPTSGVYTVSIAPQYAATVGMSLLFSQALQVPLTLDGASSNVTLAMVGQPARLTFNGIAGQNLGLGITGLTLSPADSTFMKVSVYMPDGTLWTGLNGGCYSTVSGCQVNLSKLPMTGTYSVVITPTVAGTGSFTATLSSDMTGTLIAGTPLGLNISRAGQNGRLTFTGSAGTSPTLTFSAMSTSPAGKEIIFAVHLPNGGYFTSMGSTQPSATLTLTSLPTTGTYTLFVDPDFAATATMSMILSP